MSGPHLTAEERNAIRQDVNESFLIGQGDRRTILRLLDEIEAREGQTQTCSTCYHWASDQVRGYAQCLNSHVRHKLIALNTTFETRAEFGCNQWKAKGQP